jgi:hypothetical protein
MDAAARQESEGRIRSARQGFVVKHLDGPPLAEVDIKIAAYQEALDLCHTVALRYGDMPKVAIIELARRLEQLIQETANG